VVGHHPRRLTAIAALSLGASCASEPRRATPSFDLPIAATSASASAPARPKPTASATPKPAPPPTASATIALDASSDAGVFLLDPRGADHLRDERDEGERRRSEHRGAYQGSSYDRWRSAIESYVAAVKPGNQTALGNAALPFATYLNSMHNRVHPIFADSFLDSLDALPATNALNDLHLVTALEIVLDANGAIVRLGVVRSSGVTAFDIAALDSFSRAAPFGKPPPAIVSPDGNVYVHWELHRDEVYACSTMNARPFLLAPPITTP
jgi:TonB family protein